MSRAVVTLNGRADMERAVRWIGQAPPGSRVEIKGPARSLDQNAKLWACLTEIACQVEWHGQRLTPDDWKDIFTASLRKARVVPNLDGDGFVILGLRTSDMSKGEFSELLELIHAFAAERRVVFRDDRKHAA